MLQVGILAHKREGMQAFSCASGAGCALTRDHESRRGRKSPGGDWREAPFRPCEQARGRKGDSAPTLRVFPARRTRNPACGGTRKRPLRGLHEKDGPAPFQHKECGGGATAPNLGKMGKRWAKGGSPKWTKEGRKFPEISHPPTGGFPIWCAEAKPPGGEGRRMKLASRRRIPRRSLAARGGAPASLIRRGSAYSRSQEGDAIFGVRKCNCFGLSAGGGRGTIFPSFPEGEES